MQADELAILDVSPLPCPRRMIDRRTVQRMIEATVAAAFNLPVEELQAKTRRTAPVAFARQVSMYCAHVTFGWSLTEAGALFGRDRTTAAHACRVVEDRRDDETLDKLVQAIEDALHAWMVAMSQCRKLSPRFLP